jgi:uncharacterized membrane protein YedE/YeeE
MKTKEKHPYMNPYVAGVLLGLVLIMAFYFTGHGLGASGGVKEVIVKTVTEVAPKHTENSAFFSKYAGKDIKLKDSWMVLEVLGVIVGGFISGAISGRFKFKIEKSPKITNRKRLIYALLGGVLFGIGSQFSRGCASGAALSGMAVMSVSGFIVFLTVFGTAFAVSRLFKNLWI